MIGGKFQKNCEFPGCKQAKRHAVHVLVYIFENEASKGQIIYMKKIDLWPFCLRTKPSFSKTVTLQLFV